jgi:FAD/FMN-containing dehydrogenase
VPPLLAPPPGFRGLWATGPEAADLASRISGPFRLASEPAGWAAPEDAEDLARVVGHAREEGVPLVPRGAGTGMPGGNLGPGIVVSLRELREQTLVGEGSDPAEMRIVAGAGVTAREVDALARTRALEFPPLPSSAAWASVGGIVASNAAGARSFGHGAVAAWVESVEGVDAQGRFLRLGPGDPLPLAWEGALPRGDDPLFRGWPQLRKNSSGYALDRYRATKNPAQLAVGSEGTLLLVTSATLRLRPFDPVHGVAVLPVGGPDEAGALAAAAPEWGAVACEFLGRRLLDMAQLDQDPVVGTLARGAFALYLLAFEGPSEDAVRSAMEAALGKAGREDARGRGPGGGQGVRGRRALATTDPDLAQRLWGLRHRASPLVASMAGEGRFSTQFIEDSVVPPHRLGAYLAGLDRILAREGRGMDAVVFGHAGDGNVHVNPLVDLADPHWEKSVRDVLEAVVELVVSLGGTLAGEHGDGRLRAPFLERVWGAETTGWFRRLREAADPDGGLNPGVIIPLPGQDPLHGLRPGPRSWPPGGAEPA